MLKTSESTKSTTRPGKGGVEVGGDGGDDGGHDDEIHLKAQDKRINDSLTSAARVMVNYKEVDRGKSGAIGKSVKKSSKVEELLKSSKSLKGLKNLQRPLI